MSTEKIVNTLYIETYCHATESLRKVEKAIRNLIPEELRNKVKFSYQKLEGYYGNPIIVIRSTINDSEVAQKIVEHIVSLMDSSDKNYIKNTLELRLDNSGNLYLRIDKQQAFKGKVRVIEHDDVIKLRIGLKPHIRKLETVEYYLKKIGIVE